MAVTCFLLRNTRFLPYNGCTRPQRECSTLTPILRICQEYSLDLTRYARTGLRVGIWASSGRGKSFGVGVFCEELLAASIPVVAIDPEGELFTLRERFRILVVGGEHGDLPLPFGRGGVRFALERALGEGIGLVIDLSDRATNKAQQEAARPWLEEMWVLMSERRAPAALVVEEVHIFAPQSGPSVTADIMQRFAKQGRKRGVVLVAASQRTQAVSKEFMSQLNFPAIGGFETERDYEAVRFAVDGHGFDSFRNLEPGQFYLPAAGGFHRWRDRLTSHGGDAPTWEPDTTSLTDTRDEELDALVEQLRAAFDAEAPESDGPDPVAVAQARIRQLERDLKQAHQEREEALEEAKKLQIALQVAGLIKVVVQQEVIARAQGGQLVPPPATAAGEAVAPVQTVAKPAEPTLKDARIRPEQLLEAPQVKVMLRRAKDRARKRAPRSTDYLHAAVKLLANGAALNATELAARFGYYGKVTINRMDHVLNALAGVGFAVYRNGRYSLNEPLLVQTLRRDA